MWQQRPLTAGPVLVEQGVDDLLQVIKRWISGTRVTFLLVEINKNAPAHACVGIR
jgi:hypothetical protein